MWYSLLFLFVFNWDAALAAVAFPAPFEAGVWWAEQPHQLWKRGKASVCGLQFSCFIMFQRKDLRH